MRIVFNSHSPEEAGAKFSSHAFSLAEADFTFGDWNNYDKYDVALIMQHAADLPEVDKARAANPRIKIGIVDPRGKNVLPYAKRADFLIVNSLEQRDYFLSANRNIFTYHWYMPFPSRRKIHQRKGRTVIAYHGNKVHLASIFPRITRAMERLGEKHDLEFWAIYNVRDLGQWKSGMPRNVPVKHIQWTPEVYEEHLSQADIGIVPNCMPLRNDGSLKRKGVVSEAYFLDREEDFLMRFKVPSNVGRIIVFEKLGIPVVADLYPSAVKFIEDGHSGFTAFHEDAWHDALGRLVESPELRQSCADNLTAAIADRVDYKSQNRRLLEFINNGLRPREDSVAAARSSSFTEDLAFRLSVFDEAYLTRHRRRFAKLMKAFR